MENKSFKKGRGAQINPANPYFSHNYEIHPLLESEEDPKTEFITVHPKTILNQVNSPDVGAGWSMNPYQGCEHGCVYCYARNTHTYWGYSAGLEFEQKILVKKNAPQLLEEKLKHPKWLAVPVMLAGNTDCYQPIERKLGITRELLEVFWKYRHPVSVITKNSLILRDLDLLKRLHKDRLVHVSLSITTLDDDLRKILEPRTSSIPNRLKAVEILANEGIPVNVMMAPIIPGLNEHEIFEMVKTVAELGASSIHYTMVRLNGDIAEIFADWIERTLPERADKVLSKIRQCHDGKLNDSRFGIRMTGEGKIAESISEQFRIAKNIFMKDREKSHYNLELHEKYKSPQLKLF